MDPHSFMARAEAQRWLGISEKLLIGHDLVGSKTFAIRARESDPRLEAADQILAIADTLLAAEKRVVVHNGNHQPDLYAILQLARFVQDTEHIADQYRRLAFMLNPHQNRFPYADQAFQVVNEAWSVLSNPLRKSLYDAELDFSPPQQMTPIGFNLELQHQQQQQHHHHQQQHNFFSIPNHIHEQELPEPPQIFQTRAQQSHLQQQLQQHNFLSQSNPIRPVAVREQEQLFQPFHIESPPRQQTRPPPQPSMQLPTPPPPAAPPQSPVAWPQAPPPSQPPQQPKPQPQPQLQQLQQQEQEQEQQQQQQQEQQQQQQKQQEQQQQQQHQQAMQQEQQQQQKQHSREQNAAPVELPREVNDNGVMEEEEEIESETAEAAENVNESSTIWTSCPYCFYMYEYPRVYADCALRCDHCKRAFQALPIPSPPPIVEGQEAYFCCWGFLPLGVSMSHLEKNKGTGMNSNWTPFSSLYSASNDVREQERDHLNGRAAPKENVFGNKSSGPRFYTDDVPDDVFGGISESSEDSDVEWGSTRKKKKLKRKKKGGLGYKKKSQVPAVDATGGRCNNLQDGIPVQEGVAVPTTPVAESSKKALGGNPRRQSGKVAKELGKLDLNVEFNNNEGEEPAPGMTIGNRGGHGHGEEDNIEGIGFFEGLDEFLSSLPILSVVNDEKVKAA